SGGLDFLGLAGLKVLYLQPQGTVDDRMRPVIETFNSLQNRKGITPNIQRVDIQRNPKRWKEYDYEGSRVAFPDPERKPSPAPASPRGGPKPLDMEKKGFLGADLMHLITAINFELR